MMKLIRFGGLLIQKVFLIGIAGRKMEDGKLSGAGCGGQQSGLPGSEMLFFGGNFLVFLQKGRLDEKMICISGK